MSVQKTRPALPRNLKELLALLGENTAPEDVTQQATKIKDTVLMQFGIKTSVAASVLLGKCYYQVPTTAVDTMAVMLLADGTAALLYNPYFTVDLGIEGARFVLFHESRHLIYRHLYAEPELATDDLFRHACEIGINHDTKVRLDRLELPKIPVKDEDGNPVVDAKGTPKLVPTGIDPQAEYAKYAKDLKGQGLTPVSYEKFVETDMTCYTELKRMAKPPTPPSLQICLHHGGGSDGMDGGGQVPMDADTAEELVKEALRSLMGQALAGSEAARRELLELADRTEGTSERAAKLWGDMGLGRLRGQTLATRRVDWWKQWFNDVMASRLIDGERLTYNKKRGALDLMLGNDPILSRRGQEEEKLALIAIDTSGSIPDHVLNYLTQLVGFTDGVQFEWVAFDGVVTPFKPGEKVIGGGGTNFQNVVDYAEGRLSVDGQRLDSHPDVVVMLTDGYAPEVRPAEPDKWIWLITEHGTDAWIRAQPDPMESHKITTGDGV